MTRRTQRIIVGLLALALIVPVGALGIGQLFRSEIPDPAVSATPTDPRPEVDPASQPKPSPTAAPPTVPGQDQRTLAGAEAAVRNLLGSYAYMMATGDVKLWQNLVAPECKVCSTFISNTQYLHSIGGYQVGGEFNITKTEGTVEGDPPTQASVTVDFTQNTAQLIDNPKKAPHQLQALNGRLTATFTWTDSGWKVKDMILAPKG
ncbi:DUF6318 family protein [Devriesea agamarum]|uniref:DUF6318 family protein n=1 Tax=Devriesea agamarum TaxID=472569 RepID=UPI00071E5D15|nr:DUF6318 family protein [Devriesea agamarum]